MQLSHVSWPILLYISHIVWLLVVCNYFITTHYVTIHRDNQMCYLNKLYDLLNRSFDLVHVNGFMSYQIMSCININTN
jgi:hypothetical protein